MFYIRADGNPEIGMGHVMRCLSIADALTLKGHKPVFITSTEESLQMIHRRGYETILLETDYQEMELEIRQIASIMQKNPHREKNIILVDSYQVTEPYFISLRNYAKVACMEDMGYSYPVDMLINYNIYGPQMEYTGNFKKILGTQYVPLRKEFREDCDYIVKDTVTDVMLTTGGSDPKFISKAILEGCLADARLQNINYHVISGPFNRYEKELMEYVSNFDQVTVYKNVKSMKEIMKRCDVILTATGSTLYEISALGVPMICFYFADNQQPGARCLAEQTSIVNAGNIIDFREMTLRNLKSALLHCVEDKKYRERIAYQEKQLVDGYGAERIAEELMKL